MKPDQAETNMVYDETSYTVKVTVTDDGKGHLTATPDEGNPTVSFSNTYTASGSWTPTGSKMLTGTQYNSTEFEYEVTENGQVVSTGTNSENGAITFTAIQYSQSDVGPHTYTIQEKPGTRTDIAYDTTKYTVSVNVADQGNGYLEAAVVNYLKDGAVVESVSFTNTYKASTRRICVCGRHKLYHQRGRCGYAGGSDS